MSKARSDSMTVNDDDHDVDRPHHREDDPEERLARVRAVDRRRLTQRRVDALQAGQVQDHDVADVAPAGRDEDGPDVEARVAQPVDGGCPRVSARGRC